MPVLFRIKINCSNDCWSRSRELHANGVTSTQQRYFGKRQRGVDRNQMFSVPNSTERDRYIDRSSF